MEGWLKIKFMDNRSNPTHFSECLYLNGAEVTEVVVPESITVLGDNQFKGLKNLKTIKMHDGITSIGNNTFQGCISLKPFDIPKSLTTIGPTAFHHCYAFDKPIDLSETKVDSIGDAAFYMCYNIPSVTLPSTLKYLGERAFGTDTCLVSIISYIEEPTMLRPQKYSRRPFDRFDDLGYRVSDQPVYRQATLYVPKGTVEAYQQSVAFAPFQHITEISTEVKLGDANSDQAVDVADVVAIVNYILGEPNDPFVEAAADVNGDGKIDVDDVVAVVNIILDSGQQNAREMMRVLKACGFKF